VTQTVETDSTVCVVATTGYNASSGYDVRRKTAENRSLAAAAHAYATATDQSEGRKRADSHILYYRYVGPHLAEMPDLSLSCCSVTDW
jgi:hypothetical protein